MPTLSSTTETGPIGAVDATPSPRDGVEAPGAPRRSASAAFLRGVAWSGLAAFFAAGYLIPYRFGVEATPRVTAMTAMLLSAGVFNASVALAMHRRAAWRFDRVAVLAAVALGALTIVGNFGIARALPDIGAGMTNVVLKSQVVLTPILGAWALSERMSGRFWAGGALALIGVSLPTLTSTEGLAGSAGYAWALGAALGFAGMQVVTRRVIAQIQPASVNALRLVMVVGALHLLPEGRQIWSMTGLEWTYAALAGILGPGLSRLCLMTAVRYISPSLSALIALISPVFAFGLGAAFFREAPSPTDFAGAGLILVGVLWALLGQPRSRADPLID